MTAILSFFLITALIVLFIVFTAYAKTKLDNSRLRAENDRLERAVDLARGHLFGTSSAEIPGISDGAIRALDAIDQAMKENT